MELCKRFLAVVPAKVWVKEPPLFVEVQMPAKPASVLAAKAITKLGSAGVTARFTLLTLGKVAATVHVIPESVDR